MKHSKQYHPLLPKLRSFVQSRTKNPVLTDDVVQETLLRTFNSADLTKVQNPLAYMVTVSKSVLFDHWKVKQNIDTDYQLESIEDQKADVEETFLQQEKVRILANALDEMPALRRRVFEMRRLEGKGREEIAKELNLSVEAVKKHIQRALIDLTACAEKHGWTF